MNKETSYVVYVDARPAPNLNQAPADPNGTYYGVTFKNGYAFLDWRELGAEQTYDIAQRLGRDGRFEVHEYLLDTPPAGARTAPAEGEGLPGQGQGV